MYDAVAQDCLLPHRALICDQVRFQLSQGAPLCDPKNLLGPMTTGFGLPVTARMIQPNAISPPKTLTLHAIAVTVNDLQRGLGGRCCMLGLNHRLGLFPKDSGWLVRLPGRQPFVAGVACRRCPFPLAAGLLACVWRSQLFAAVGVRETQCAAQFASAVVRVVLLRSEAGRRRCRRLGCPGSLLPWCCWGNHPGRCRRPSPWCVSAPLFVVAIVGGAGVFVTA